MYRFEQANRFREKPWLTQVQQAMIIANRGVKRIIDREEHLFSKPSRDPNDDILAITEGVSESPLVLPDQLSNMVKSPSISSVAEIIL